ncbi:hypothetical protein NPIL_154911 [Nephila pilipes]|uniref:Uncharacterized protein n=1 Tax=Nephila pilipes TaxID=299642 RepID=A0A8X6UG15_NEPPI|nr:hypothetical protein NPIL_154911 [Nephila pilipes]
MSETISQLYSQAVNCEAHIHKETRWVRKSGDDGQKKDLAGPGFLRRLICVRPDIQAWVNLDCAPPSPPPVRRPSTFLLTCGEDLGVSPVRVTTPHIYSWKSKSSRINEHTEHHNHSHRGESKLTGISKSYGSQLSYLLLPRISVTIFSLTINNRNL